MMPLHLRLSATGNFYLTVGFLVARDIVDFAFIRVILFLLFLFLLILFLLILFLLLFIRLVDMLNFLCLNRFDIL